MKRVIPFILAGVSLSLQAAEPISLESMAFSTLQHQFVIQLPNATQSLHSSRHALRWLSEHQDERQVKHVRMQQTYAGFPVFGGDVILHTSRKSVNRANDPTRMNGMVYEGLEPELGEPSHAFLTGAADALAHYKASYKTLRVTEESVKPMIYIDASNHAVWAYQVSLFILHDNQIPERPTAILDAKTLIPFLEWDDLKSVKSLVKGAGYGGNAHTKKYHYGNERPFLDITRDTRLHRCAMENPLVKVIDMKNDYTDTLNTAMYFDCDEGSQLLDGSYWTGYQKDGYDTHNGAYSPSNDALYAGDVIHRMYREWFGFHVLSKGKKPMQLVMRVHYGRGYENAYWDGLRMTFGDGASMMYPLVSLGVGAHEISHGFTEQHSNLAYFGQSGGINEAFSDMAAQAAEFYSSGKNSWSIGGDIMKARSGYEALRFMEKPSQDGRSIDSADQYRANMDVHYSSGVFNRLFYLLAHQAGWNVRQAFHVMVKANMDYWLPQSTFEMGGCGVLSAARDLDFSVVDVQRVLDQVAIPYTRCIIS